MKIYSHFFSNYFANKAILFFFIVLLFSQFITSFSHVLPFLWIIISTLTVTLFFRYLAIFSKKWNNLSSRSFSKLLFRNSFLIRFVFVIISYIFFYLTTGKPFEFDAADSVFYYEMSTKLTGFLLVGDFNLWENLSYIAYSDRGYLIFLSIVNIVGFQTILFPRIINSLLGAYTSVLVYKFAKRNFEENTARISAIMFMLLPNMIYYCGLHLKEVLMVYLVVAFIELADSQIRSNRFRFKDILVTSLFGISLFLFRTVLGGVAFASLFVALAFTSSRISQWRKRIFAGVGIGLLVFTLLSAKIIQEVEQYWEERTSNLESQMQNFSTRTGANRLAEYGSTVVFAPIILFAPFPTLVNIEGQENHMMLGGTYYTRNVYAFFVIIGLIGIYKRKIIRNHILILTFLLSYLAVLANSGFALSERFHMPIIPFLVILAALGITKINKKNKIYFVPYLVVISIIIIGWNWFKLAGRDML